MRIRPIVAVVGVVGIVSLGLLILTQLNGLSTRAEPSALERVVARVVRQLGVPRRARTAQNPIPFTPDAWAAARAHFADHCASCHGNDGGGATEIGRRLYPRSPDMRLDGTQRRTDGELYWIIENGVRLTGMPAWGDGSSNDADTWRLVHFVRHLKDLTEEQLKEMAALNPKSPSELEEEQQDREFLEGQDSQPGQAPQHHHH